MEERDPLTEKIIACCFKVHRELGPGFSEKIYQNALRFVLNEAKLKFELEKEHVVLFQNKKVGNLRLDLVVEDKIIVEVKALATHIPEVFKHQLLSYLKVTNLHVGLLVNFGNKSCEVKRFMF